MSWRSSVTTTSSMSPDRRRDPGGCCFSKSFSRQPTRLDLAKSAERGARGPVGLEHVDLVADLARVVLEAGRPRLRQRRSASSASATYGAHPSIALRQPDVVGVRASPCRRSVLKPAGKSASDEGPGLGDLHVVTRCGRGGRRRGRRRAARRGQHGDRGPRARARENDRRSRVPIGGNLRADARAYLITLPSLDVAITPASGGRSPGSLGDGRVPRRSCSCCGGRRPGSWCRARSSAG